MIPETYFDVIVQTRRQVQKAGVDLTDQDIYEAIVRHEGHVYGYEDFLRTDATVAKLLCRTPTIHTALVGGWVGKPTIANPAVTPILQDHAGNPIVPMSQDLRSGIWIFSEKQDIVYIQGTYVDIMSAAVECIDLILDGSYDIVTTTGELGSVQLGDIFPHLERQRTRLLSKRNPMPVTAKG